MPELPEVETLRRSLLSRLPGCSVRRVEVRSPALREPLDHDALVALEGWTVRDLDRRAKYLLVGLVPPGQRSPATESAQPRLLAIHLGMSGRLTVVADEEPYGVHEHLALHLTGPEGGSAGRLRLVDPRRFGQAFVLRRDELATDRHFSHLGIEPLAGAFDGDHLAQRAAGRRGPVKSFLMDASVVVGVGNIYASEALWRAGVHPKRSVARVSLATWTRLAEAVRDVLADAIAQGGTTLNDFTDGEGNAGYFQVSLDAYDREGEPCRRCGRPIRRIVQSNRSTYYCPGCQR